MDILWDIIQNKLPALDVTVSALLRGNRKQDLLNDVLAVAALLSIRADTHVASRSAHPKYIQAQLGHASIQTTLDRYGRLTPDAHAAEARKLDQLVFGDAPRGKWFGDAAQR